VDLFFAGGRDENKSLANHSSINVCLALLHESAYYQVNKSDVFALQTLKSSSTHVGPTTSTDFQFSVIVLVECDLFCRYNAEEIQTDPRATFT